MRRKHTHLEKEKYPKDCEFCDYDCRSKEDEEKHLRKHTFKKPLFKCDNCDLVVESLLNLQVHIGKQHSGNFECGLCDYAGNTLDNLETHYLTCEVYTCKRCTESFYNLSNVKDHLKAKHMKHIRNTEVEHIKMDKKYFENVTSKTWEANCLL